MFLLCSVSWQPFSQFVFLSWGCVWPGLWPPEGCGAWRGLLCTWGRGSSSFWSERRTHRMCPQQPLRTFCLLPCAAFRGRRVPTKGSGLALPVDVAADSRPLVLGSLAAGALPVRPGVCAELLGGMLGASRRLCWLSVSFSGFPRPRGSGAALPVAVMELGPGSCRSRRSSRPSRAPSPTAWTPCTAFVPKRSGRAGPPGGVAGGPSRGHVPRAGTLVHGCWLCGARARLLAWVVRPSPLMRVLPRAQAT